MPNQAPTPQTYHWGQVVDAEQWVLFRGSDCIGMYDKSEDVYKRMNTDGTLSDASPRPWRTHAALVPMPPPLAEQAVKSKTFARPAEEGPPLEGATATAAPEEKKEKGRAGSDKSKVERLLQELPPWSLYAAGGSVAGLALLFGLVARGRRPAPK